MQIYFLDTNNQNWIGLKIDAATIFTISKKSVVV